MNTTSALPLDRIPVLFLSLGTVDGTTRARATDSSEGATDDFGFLKTDVGSLCGFSLTDFKPGYMNESLCEQGTEMIGGRASMRDHQQRTFREGNTADESRK